MCVCVCVCVWRYVYVCVCTCIGMHACVHEHCMHVCVHAYVPYFVSLFVMCVCVCVCTCTCAVLCILNDISVWVCVCVCACTILCVLNDILCSSDTERVVTRWFKCLVCSRMNDTTPHLGLGIFTFQELYICLTWIDWPHSGNMGQTYSLICPIFCRYQAFSSLHMQLKSMYLPFSLAHSGHYGTTIYKTTTAVYAFSIVA